jgi:protein involved in polysaccharide export with SLBB domain
MSYSPLPATISTIPSPTAISTGNQPNPAFLTAPTTPSANTPASAPGLLNGYVPDDTYKLRAGDTVSFQVQEDQIWNPLNIPITLVVEDSGEIEVPYIGRVMAVNKTCKQLTGEIKAALEKDYYKQATVVLSMNVASPILGRVYIWGQVHDQGALDIQVNENLTAGEAILRAGGFADFANERKVKVVRTMADGQKKTFDLDMNQILDEGKTENDIVLQPGDLILVPSRLVNF